MKDNRDSSRVTEDLDKVEADPIVVCCDAQVLPRKRFGVRPRAIVLPLGVYLDKTEEMLKALEDSMHK